MKKIILNTILIAGLIFLYTPLVILIFFSFNNFEIINLWGGFTFKWYYKVIHDKDIISATFTSLKIAIITSIIATILGTIVAYIMNKFTFFKSKNFLYGLVTTPLILPDIILGISLLLMFSTLQHLIGWPNELGITTIVIAHVTMCTAYVTILMQSHLNNTDISLEEAALDLGAKPINIFFKITMPQLMPALITSILLTFTLSIDDLVITEFVSGSNNLTLPIYIYSTVKNGPTPKINALATIIIGIIIIIVSLGMFISIKFQKK